MKRMDGKMTKIKYFLRHDGCNNCEKQKWADAAGVKNIEDYITFVPLNEEDYGNFKLTRYLHHFVKGDEVIYKGYFEMMIKKMYSQPDGSTYSSETLEVDIKKFKEFLEVE